ncbi:MAG: hypothetical protein ABW219_11685 [Ilumatobacteraceae bacterium]
MEDHDDETAGPLDAGATRTEHERIDTYADADRERVAAANKLDRDRSMIAHGRRIGGLPGAMVAGALIAVRDIYEGPKRDEGVVVVDAPSEPHDVDRDGVALSAEDIGGDQDIAVAALPRREPIVGTRRSSRRRSR